MPVLETKAKRTDYVFNFKSYIERNIKGLNC